MKQLHPRAVWLFFIPSLFKILIFLIVMTIWLTTVLMGLSKNVDVFGYVGWFFVAVFFMLVFSYIWAKLSYKFYKYELTENGFRKELGVIYKKYVTIPYDRIQNVDIYRGIMARILGLSDLNIQTAGSSSPLAGGGYSGGSEGRLPGLSKEEAEQLRDELIIRAKQSKNQGL